MALVKIDIVRSVPKESHEIFVMIRKLVVTLRNGGDYTSLIGDVVKAVDGFTNLGDELKGDALCIAADGVAEILGLIEDLQIPKPVPVV